MWDAVDRVDAKRTFHLVLMSQNNRHSIRIRDHPFQWFIVTCTETQWHSCSACIASNHTIYEYNRFSSGQHTQSRSNVLSCRAVFARIVTWSTLDIFRMEEWHILVLFIVTSTHFLSKLDDRSLCEKEITFYDIWIVSESLLWAIFMNFEFKWENKPQTPQLPWWNSSLCL